ELDDAMLRETRLTRLLLGENEAICTPSRWVYRSSAGDQHADAKDDSGILERIIAVRTARRRRDMSGSDLLRAISRAGGNLASKYAMEYETVATLLHWPAPAPDASADPAMRSTVWLAAESLRSADRLGRPHAQMQARCNLAEALLHSGQIDECLN